MQQIYVLLSCLLFLYAGKRFTEIRPVSYLLSGAFLLVLIRELDTYFDVIYNGAWLPVALVTLAGILYAMFPQRHALASSVERFIATPAVGLLVAGGLGVFVFARLFGTKDLWMDLFEVSDINQEHIYRWAKSAAQEGSELFGYCLIFCASIELISYASRRYGSEAATKSPGG